MEGVFKAGSGACSHNEAHGQDWDDAGGVCGTETAIFRGLGWRFLESNYRFPWIQISSVGSYADSRSNNQSGLGTEIVALILC